MFACCSNQADVDRDQVIALGAEGDVRDLEALIHPADEEEAIERDTEVVIIDHRDVFDVDSCNHEMVKMGEVP